MSDKKIIAVLGATGAQGGGVVDAILNDLDGSFQARAITRSATAPKAVALAERGAEVVEASLEDEDSLRAAFEGAYGVFVVTNFWDSFSADVELAQAARAARAVAAAGPAHVVWSTLEDTRKVLPLSDKRVPVLQERYSVPHFDAKAEADEFFRKSRVPTTFLRTTFYWDNFITGFAPRRDENGALVLALPIGQAALPGIASEDIGRTAYGVFLAGDTYRDKTVSIAGEHLTGAQYAEAFADALGEPVTYYPVPHDQVRAADLPASDEMGNMFQFYTEGEHDFVGSRDLDVVRSLNPRLKNFRTWLDEHLAEVKPA
ncbi:nucleotide-diphosphate-sugar epimerase [Lentzea pudingi]|uniref:Nucleotide-diphosphate-sugar epimerase n=1 Tax=Lentzea pudingi TaxID=1789439 RepID=A0ABQ2HYC4_9PSEU|nr:NmrA/HSCARG family protein [Lentzea pudingi]GGM93533.1 nucleotide-diphosphate-sugar epimerase [Lentzea pudingi]